MFVRLSATITGPVTAVLEVGPQSLRALQAAADHNCDRLADPYAAERAQVERLLRHGTLSPEAEVTLTVTIIPEAEYEGQIA